MRRLPGVIFLTLAAALTFGLPVYADTPDYGLRSYEYEHKYNLNPLNTGVNYQLDSQGNAASASSVSQPVPAQANFSTEYSDSLEGILNGGQALVDSAREAELDSGSIQAHLKRAEIFLAQRQREKAVSEMGRLIAMSPDACGAYLFRIPEYLVPGPEGRKLAGYVKVKGLSCAERQKEDFHYILSLNKK